MEKSNVTVLYSVGLFYVALVFLFVNKTEIYFGVFNSEFGVSELLGAFLLFATSIVLFIVAKVYKPLGVRFFYLFLLAGGLFFWAAGEEISWGQHFFGTVTPDWLKEINGQGETNIHNINKKFFDRIVDRVPLLLVAVSCVMALKKKVSLFNIRLLDVPLCLSFILMVIYRRHGVIDTNVWTLYFIFLFPMIYLGLREKDKSILLMCSFVIFCSVFVVYGHNKYSHLFGRDLNVYHEIREMVFSLLCFFYAISILSYSKMLKYKKQGGVPAESIPA